MPPVYPGGSNVYVPAAVASLQTNFTQNPSKFKINQYVTVAPVDKMNGYYNFHDPTEETRINYANMADHMWPDGTYPQVDTQKGNNFLPYMCTRYKAMFSIGDLAQEQADWSVIADHAQTAMMRLMTIRTFNVLTALTTGANWGANTATATALAGGKWNASSSTLNYILESIQAAVVAIQKGTNSTVETSDLVMIMSPTVANAIRANQEIIDQVKQSPVIQTYLTQPQSRPGSGANYGLPDPLFGIPVIVEDRVYNSAPHGATPVNDYILGDSVFIVARPGSLMGQLNTMSTATLAMYQDVNMVMEHKTTALLTEGVLYDNYATIIRPESGFLITDTL